MQNVWSFSFISPNINTDIEQLVIIALLEILKTKEMQCYCGGRPGFHDA